MTRDDLEFDIHYSYFVEKMNFTLFNRIDKAITLALIVLGFSVFAPYSNLFVFGFFVALLSVLQLVYQFGQTAGFSKEQFKKYSKLLVNFNELSDAELREQIIKAQNADNLPWQSLEYAAHNRACIFLGKTENLYRLNFRQKCICFIAGDIPNVQS
ncbi:TPA: hypothetical protein R8G76_001384 [Citrobacter youngae]|nr:hypothetical protein [Citrobacter youngae]